MAKHLKLNIKNEQLAQALKLKEPEPKKKKATQKKPAKAAAPKKKPEEVEAPEKKKPKAKKAHTLQPITKEKPQPAEKVATEKAPEEKKEEPKAKAKAVPEHREVILKRAAPEKPKEKAGEKKPEAKKTTKPPFPPKAALQKKKTALAKEYRDIKQTRRFDSRDQRGLGAVEEGAWRRRRHQKTRTKVPEELIERPKELKIKLPITIKDLAQAMKHKTSALIAKLFAQGIPLTLNDYLDDETTVQLLGHEFGCEIEIDTTEEERLQITDKTIEEEIKEANPEKLIPRPSVIAFMGHVDHGKTSLIDYIRKSDVAAKEAGSITQHIGAFKCHANDKEITILDTPGHEAFSAMRKRGAHVTDLIILVVAGDEGIKPQTDEAIEQAKKANVPVLVAINKCDKPDFNADEIYRQLSERELLPEVWGGSTVTVNTSAQTGQGIPDLLEMILLQAELLELKADPSIRARGTVLESELHKGLGSSATLLVQNGTLHPGDALVFDEIYGRVKTMHDEHAKLLKNAKPSTAVQIAGLSGIPEAGTEFIVVQNEKEAKQLVGARAAGTKHRQLHRPKKEEGFEELLTRQQELAAKKVLPLILKADVQGSLEALKNSLLNLPSDKVELNFVSEGVGEISESDIELAAASGAKILGFHTKIEAHAQASIKRAKVIIKSSDVIYHLIDDVKALMTEMLDKIREEHEMGTLEVKALFKSSGLGIIAGCQVTEGIVKRTHIARLYRNDKELFSGEIASLKRVKEDIKEVKKGFECGILLSGFKEFEVGDIIKTFEVAYRAQEL